MSNALIAFDFDGTLYPPVPNDSEDWILLKAGRGNPLKALLARYAILSEHLKSFNFKSYNKVLNYNAKNMSVSCIDEIVDAICTQAQNISFEPLYRLKEMGNTLAIVSCGTDVMIERFLERFGITDLFAGFKAKRLLFDEKKVLGYDFGEVDGPDFKVRTCLQYKEEFNCSSIISIGDGATDIAMFKHSDYAVFMDWANKHQGSEREGYPLVHDFEQLHELIKGHLEKTVDQ